MHHLQTTPPEWLLSLFLLSPTAGNVTGGKVKGIDYQCSARNSEEFWISTNLRVIAFIIQKVFGEKIKTFICIWRWCWQTSRTDTFVEDLPITLVSEINVWDQWSLPLYIYTLLLFTVFPCFSSPNHSKSSLQTSSTQLVLPQTSNEDLCEPTWILFEEVWFSTAGCESFKSS